MDSLDLNILQGKLVGSTFTLELLIDKINKGNPKGEWLSIVNDLKNIVDNNKRVSLALYTSFDINQTLNKALNIDLGVNTSDLLKKLLTVDNLEKENKRLKNEIYKMINES